MAGNDMDWQVGLRHIGQRANKILESGQWSDCTFIVGNDSSQETIQAHRLILAMGSPVFEAMFYGSMADKEEKPIEILDVRPQAFKDLLKYIYADEINFTSFDQVCEICYAAKKYMIPPLVGKCTQFIWKDLDPRNVCRAYAFVRLFEEPQLLEKCMSMIKTLTEDVVRDQSFEDVDISTLKAILGQEILNCSEFDLWEGVARWSQQECARQSIEPSPPNQRKVIQELLPMFRFLTLSPTQFANGPALSGILTHEECFSLLMNISSPGVVAMPPTFSASTTARRPPPPPRPQAMHPPVLNIMEESHEQMMCHCSGDLIDIFVNEQLVDCTLAFSVDADVRIVGVILPTQLKPQGPPHEALRDHNRLHRTPTCFQRHVNSLSMETAGTFHHHPIFMNKYPELIYAFLQDDEGCRLTYTHFSARVSWEGTMEVLFNRPIYIKPNSTYKIVVVLNKMGRYPLFTTLPHVTVGNINFTFEIHPTNESIVKTLILEEC